MTNQPPTDRRCMSLKHLPSLFCILFALNVIMGTDSVAVCIDNPASPTSAAAAQIRSQQVIEIGGAKQEWFALEEADFENANCKLDTWAWKDDRLSCLGNCVGVLHSKKQYDNFELTLEWKHLRSAGNSGVFIWTPKSSLDGLKPNALPAGIECQILDHGYTEQYERQSGNKADWFTTNGDVFPVGKTKMKPFAPVSPNGVRSFPSANHSNGFGQWNHYYIRAINGEVRLWVNGHEVSGGNRCNPATGFLCLESEGSPIDFRKIKIRLLP